MTAVSNALVQKYSETALTGQSLTINGSEVIDSDRNATLGAGTTYINESANAEMTTGLTINQGAADDEILALKSSDVAHGITNQAETDTYAFFQKQSASNGGLRIEGLSAGTTAFRFLGVHTTDDTTKSTAAVGCMNIGGNLKSGAGTQSLGADANIVVIRDGNNARFIFDAEGSAHADVEWTTFDDHDDLAVIEDMETLLAPSAVKRQFGDVVAHDREFFEREGLFHDIRDVGDGRMRGMMNQTRMLMLHSGAIRQVGGMVLDVEDRIAVLEDENRVLKQQVRRLLN